MRKVRRRRSGSRALEDADASWGELSRLHVDIAREFTNLIVLQRGYQANSRLVTAVDELSQDTINLKR